jgi:hypothetical protein
MRVVRAMSLLKAATEGRARPQPSECGGKRQTMGLRGQGRRVASQLRAAMTLPDARGASARWLSAAAAVPGCDARPGMAVQRAVSQLVRACPTARWLV